ncbi:MAG: pyrroline-5-carboxylate reductase [Thermodesulfobacteriota bacterium]
MTEMNRRIGFIGGGNMAEAIAGALIRTGCCPPSRIMASDVSPDRREYLQRTYGIHTVPDNTDVFLCVDVVILAVKPQIMDSVLSQLSDVIAEKNPPGFRKLIISVAAGFPIQKMESRLYSRIDPDTAARLPIARVMPNTPALVMAGMSGISYNRHIMPEDKAMAMAILGVTGSVLEFEEQALNAVTAVSGSGPAYVFYLIEAMIEAGVSLGLSETDSSALTLQTVKGAVKLLDERKEPPRDLRRKVTSPGGTTEAAITVMEQASIKDNIIKALTAACRRANELSG